MPEALAGVHAGRVLSLEKEFNFQVPRPFRSAEGDTQCTARGEVRWGLAWSKTPSMRGSTLRENRETLCPPTADGALGRDGKSEDRSQR